MERTGVAYHSLLHVSFMFIEFCSVIREAPKLFKPITLDPDSSSKLGSRLGSLEFQCKISNSRAQLR